MNYKVTIRYDGFNYCGWQIQEGKPTVQQTIRDAIILLIKQDINLIGSGRTDTGVHALGQVANFRTSEELDIYKFKYSLNSLLPDDISVNDCVPVHENFHARFDAKRRSYLYLISEDKDPFFKRYSYGYFKKPALDKLNEYSGILKDSHDYTSFAKKNTETENKICNVYDIHWRRSGNLLIMYIQADRFLHGMVRTIVGTILRAVDQNLPVGTLKEILEARDRETAGEATPAKGLFLYKVSY